MVGVDGVTGKPGKKEKKKRKQGASLAQQDLLACQDAILGRCLIGDTICIARGNECCTHLSAGRTGDAVICLIGFAGGRVR